MTTLADGQQAGVGRGRAFRKSEAEPGVMVNGDLSNERLVASNGTMFLYLKEPPPAITVEMENPVAFETRVSTLATSLQGQVIGQDNTQTNIQKLFVSLPVENLEAFKAQFGSVQAAVLSSLSLTDRAEVAQTGTNQTLSRISGATTQTVVIITGGREPVVTTASERDRSELGKNPATIVLEIQVVLPKN